MRTLVLAGLLLLLPTAVADTEYGSTVGMNLGYVSPGLWDLYHFDVAGGGVSLVLSWQRGLVVPSDYDLRLYRPGALDDGALVDGEMVAEARTRTFAVHEERMDLGLAAGTYVAAVVPFQTQEETYRLQSSAGQLRYATTAAGYEATPP